MRTTPKQPRPGRMPAPDFEPKDARLNLRVSPELRRRMHHAAIDEGVSVSDLAERVLAAWLDERERRDH